MAMGETQDVPPPPPPYPPHALLSSAAHGVCGVLAELDEMLARPCALQSRTLAQILVENASSEYLVNHGFHLPHPDQDEDENEEYLKRSFKTLLPIIDYSYVEPYVLRLSDANPSSNLLFSYDLLEFALSSGTSAGRSKMIPMTAEFFKRMPMFKFQKALEMRDFPGSEKGKTLLFGMSGQQFETKSGHKLGAFSTNIFKSDRFREYLVGMTSPPEVFASSNTQEALYCHLICGLVQAHQVTRIEAHFAFLAAEAFRMLEYFWKEIVEDIRSGTLSERIVDVEVREVVCPLLQPSAEIADFVERACSRDNPWEGIVRRLWPNAIFIGCHGSGPVMKPYISRLNSYSGNLPIVMRNYSATEGGVFGLNLDLKSAPDDVVYTLIPTVVFYEFIPVKEKQDFKFAAATYEAASDNATLELHELQVGQYYEIVVTTFQGLYRYRLGDILRVTGYNKSCPMVEYVCRKNVVLGLNTDKTDEQEIELLMSRAGEVLRRKSGMEIAEYTTHADHSKQPGHYVLFWQLSRVAMNDKGELKEEEQEERGRVLQELCDRIDSELNIEYQRGRRGGTIGPLELRVVKEGTFVHLMEAALRNGASGGQYKPPRCILSHAYIQLLNTGILHTFFSKFTPH